MKKSIFLFFAAILCAMSASAWSYKSSANGWKASTSGFTTVTMNSGKSMSVVMLKDVGDGVNICQNDDGNGQKLYCKWTKTSGDIFRGTARWNSDLYSDETVVIPGGIVYIKVGSGAQVQMTAGANYTYTADVTFSTTGQSYTISGGTVNGATINNENSMPSAGKPASLTMSNSYTSKKSGNVHIVFDLKTNKVTETADSEPEPEPEPTVTLYFVNHPEWTNLKAHVWDNNDTPYKDWNNSESMTNTGEDKDGYAVYSYTFPSKYTNIIFKGDGQQTQDNVAAYDVAKPYFCDDEWYASLAEIPALGAVVTYDYYVIGTVNGWALKDANFGMTDDNADGVYEKVVTLADGKNQMKINNGTWGTQAGYDQLDAKYEGVSRGTSGDDNNIIIDITPGKDITVKFDKNANKITLDGLTKIEDYYTVVGVAELFGTAWDRANETNKMAKQGDGSYKLVKENVTLAAIGYEWKIAKNGDWWNDAAIGVNPSEGNNTLTIATAGRYNVTFTLAADLTSATVETELLEAAVVIPDCFISGNATLTGGEGWQGNEFTMVYDEETETWAYTLAGLQPEKAYELKVVCGGTWYSYANLASIPTGVTEGNDHSIAFKMAAAGDVVVTYNVEAGITLSGNFAEPVTYDYYIAGTENLTGFNWSANGLGMEKDGDVYKHTFNALAAGTYEFKITDGQWNTAEDKTHEWGYSNLGAAYEEVSEGTDGEGNPNGNIKFVTEEAKNITVIFDATAGKITFENLTEKAPEPTFDYYITGSFNGDNPKKAENGMTLDGTVYKATVTLAAGDNTLKVTDGTWEKTWGANELGAAYEEVSNSNDGYNNIKITLAAEKEITVIFDATAGKITFEDLTPYVAPLTYTVTVPAGTEKCYIAGNMNGWAFQEMEAVTGETNKFTITIVGAKETDEYKYACQADWAYAEVIDGGGNRTIWSELDEVTAWGKPVIVTYQLKGVGGWEQPGIELVQNPVNDKEYMLTCQAISATDAIKVVRLEDGVIKDYYGNGTVKDGVAVTVSYDIDGNITLPEGKYNFYFDTNEPEKKLWIAAATDCEPTPDYTRTVASSSYGTICLPNGSDKFEGAKFYEVTYKKDGYIYAEEVTTLVAGMPYIFQATSTEIKVYYNETPAAANAGSKNGVHGTFVDITDGEAGDADNELEGNYLLVAGPKVQKCGGKCSLAANRAYFVVSEISTNETKPLPGRQRIALGCQEENQATGLDNITENGTIAPAMQGTYDILGRQLSEPAANGFYIINGKKVLVVK